MMGRTYHRGASPRDVARGLEQLRAVNLAFDSGYERGRLDALRLVFIGAACAEVIADARVDMSEAYAGDREAHWLARAFAARRVALATLRAIAELGDETARELLHG